MIFKTILGLALFINGGHIISTNLKLHHYPTNKKPHECEVHNRNYFISNYSILSRSINLL